MPPKRALVIGAGSSGLTALSQFRAAGLDAVAYEARGEVGGAWNYDEDPGACVVSFEASGRCVVRAPGERDARRMPLSPMYDSLRTNVPTTLMAYREHPFPYDTVRTRTLDGRGASADRLRVRNSRCTLPQPLSNPTSTPLLFLSSPISSSTPL